MATINTNAAGFVNFSNRDFRFAGARGTWVKIEGQILTASLASKGTIGSAYLDELSQFFSNLGLSDFWRSLKCGDRKSTTISIPQS